MYSIAKNFELIYYTDYANFNQPYPLYRQEFLPCRQCRHSGTAERRILELIQQIT